MKKLFTGAVLALLVVLGLPQSASAGQYDPYFTVSSTSYSGQPSKFVVNLVNNLSGTSPVVRVTNSPGLNGTQLSCSPGDVVSGLGNWRCTLAGTKRLSPGTLKVTAQSVGGGKKSAVVTRTASVSSRFAITSSTSPTEGESFSVRGRNDDIAGLDDVTVRARVTSGGTVVAGQSSVNCSSSGGSFNCSLRSAAGAGSTYSVRVTESLRNGATRSSTRSVQVTSTAAPATPTFSGPSVYVVTEQPRSISGDSNRSGLRIQVLVDPPAGARNWSNPTTSCTSSSGGFWSCPLAGNLPAGNHTFEARAVDPEDATKVSGVAIRRATYTKKAEPTPTPTPTPTAEPTKEPTDEPTFEAVPEPSQEIPTTPVKNLDLNFDGLTSPFSQLLLLLVLGLAVITLARPGPLSLVFGGNSVPFAEPEDEIAGRELALRRGIGIGDNSPTWRAFGHEATDFWSRELPGMVARHSPFLARLTADGVDLRAIFGTLWWLFPISAGALALGAGGSLESGVPAASVVIAIMAISCFDAIAGFVATLLFGLVTVGDIVTDKNAALVWLALGFLWTSLPLVATAIRPFRRPGLVSVKYGWDRAADLVITAALCGLLARLLASTMDVFAGAETNLPADANTIGVIAFLCIAARTLLANAVDVWWPERLRNTEIQEDLPAPSPWAILGGIAVRVAVFGFIGHAFVGNCWQLWVAVLLFVLPDLLVMARDWFDLQWQFRLPLPVGVTEIFILVVACTLLVAAAIANADSQLEALRYGLVAAALAPAVLGGVQAFEDDSKRQTGSTWDRQLAGAGILLTTVILALNGWGY